MPLTVDQIIGSRRKSAMIRTDNARRHQRKARGRYDGHLTVIPLQRGDGAPWVVCSVPGCRTKRDGKGSDFGFRPAAVEFHVAGWSLGAYCEPHGREVRRVYGELAPTEPWTAWLRALNAKVARRTP